MRLFFILSLIAIILLLRYYVTKTFSDLNENMVNKFQRIIHYNYVAKIEDQDIFFVTPYNIITGEEETNSIKSPSSSKAFLEDHID